jgi:hypothetical protein
MSLLTNLLRTHAPAQPSADQLSPQSLIFLTLARYFYQAHGKSTQSPQILLSVSLLRVHIFYCRTSFGLSLFYF